VHQFNNEIKINSPLYSQGFTVATATVMLVAMVTLVG